MAMIGLNIEGLLDGRRADIQIWYDELMDPLGLGTQYGVFGQYSTAL